MAGNVVFQRLIASQLLLALGACNLAPASPIVRSGTPTPGYPPLRRSPTSSPQIPKPVECPYASLIERADTALDPDGGALDRAVGRLPGTER